MTSRIGLLALDLDGTLMDEEDRIDSRDRRALRQAVADGLRVAVFTGRTLGSASRAIDGLLRCHIAAVNGAMIADPEGRLLRQARLGPIVGRRMVEFFRHHGCDPLLYFEDRFRYADRLDAANPVYGTLSPHLADGFRLVPSLEPLLARRPLRISIWHTTETTGRLHPLLVRRLGRWLQVYRHAYGGFSILEGISRRSTKRHALEWLASHLGVPRSRVAAIGDGINDVDMLEWAGTGIAMADGHPAARQAADRITAPLAEAGVARALAGLQA